MDEKLLQIRRAHASARPKTSNPAWFHTHNDLTYVLSCLDAAIETANPKRATKIVSDGATADDGWPKLTRPARVGNGTFGVGVSSRLVVDAAQRQHDYAQEEGARTPEQAREAERKRRELWDMLNGPLGA